MVRKLPQKGVKKDGVAPSPFKKRSKKLGKGPSKAGSDTNHLATTTKVTRIKTFLQTPFQATQRAERRDDDLQKDPLQTGKGRSIEDIVRMASHSQSAKRKVAISGLADIFKRYSLPEAKNGGQSRLQDVAEKCVQTTLALLLDEDVTVRQATQAQLLPIFVSLHTTGGLAFQPFIPAFKSALKTLVSDPVKMSPQAVRMLFEGCPELFNPSDIGILTNSLAALNNDADNQIGDLTVIEFQWINPPTALLMLALDNEHHLLAPHARRHIESAWRCLRSTLFIDLIDLIGTRSRSSPLAFLPWVSLMIDMCSPITIDDVTSIEVPRSTSSLLKGYRDGLLNTLGGVQDASYHRSLGERLGDDTGWGLCPIHSPIVGDGHRTPLSQAMPAGLWTGIGATSSGRDGNMTVTTDYQDMYLRRADTIIQACIQLGIDCLSQIQSTDANLSSKTITGITNTALSLIIASVGALVVASSQCAKKDKPVGEEDEKDDESLVISHDEKDAEHPITSAGNNSSDSDSSTLAEESCVDEEFKLKGIFPGESVSAYLKTRTPDVQEQWKSVLRALRKVDVVKFLNQSNK